MPYMISMKLCYHLKATSLITYSIILHIVNQEQPIPYKHLLSKCMFLGALCVVCGVKMAALILKKIKQAHKQSKKFCPTETSVFLSSLYCYCRIYWWCNVIVALCITFPSQLSLDFTDFYLHCPYHYLSHTHIFYFWAP